MDDRKRPRRRFPGSAPLSVVALLAVVLVVAVVVAGCSQGRDAAAAVAGPRGAVSTFVTQPALHPPRLTINGSAPRSGYIFVSPMTSGLKERAGYQQSVVIYDGRGQPVWVRAMPAGMRATTLRAQTYEGQPVLTWWQGKIVKPGVGIGEDVIFDTSYRQIAVVRAGNGFQADLHEFTITPRGTALITAYKLVPRDLSSFGGPENGKVWDSVVQEIDIRTGRVLFQWDPLEQVPLSDSYRKIAAVWDPYHLNSAEVTQGGDLLISARHTWSVYDVSRRTGRIVWRLGGRHSDFALGPGARFAWQHDAMLEANGLLSVFDNEADPETASRSRGLFLRLDPVARTATLVRQYVLRGVLAGSQGSVQLLPDGGVFVGWGQEPYFSQYTADGKLLLKATFASPYESYRAFRFAWSGHPAGPPAAAVTVVNGVRTVFMSWNGATEAVRWRVLAGADARHLSPVAEVDRQGFETSVRVGGDAACFAAEALGADGSVLGTSPPVGG